MDEEKDPRRYIGRDQACGSQAAQETPRSMTVRQLSDEELKRLEYIESCRDDGYGPRLRELRQELIRRATHGERATDEQSAQESK